MKPKKINFQEVSKGLQSEEIKLNHNSPKLKDVDVFSKEQISNFIQKALDGNVGCSAEIQKGVVDSVKKELSHLLPICITKEDKSKTFYTSKKGICVELLKAFSPKDENSFFEEPDLDEDKILDFIKENNPSDEDLIKEFGEGVIDVLNQLHKNNKIDVDEDGNYILKAEDTESTENDEENQGNSEGNDSEEDKDDIEDEQMDEEDKPEEEIKDLDSEETDTPPIDTPPTEEPKEQIDKSDENKDETTEEKPSSEEQPKNPEEESKVGDDDYTPEELEAFVKETATKSLVNFYKTSEDEDKKEVVKLELERRGFDTNKLLNDNPSDKDMNEGLPKTEEDMDELKDWIDKYFEDYDKEDLIKYVKDLILDSPYKRKELKNHYREFYSMSNGGNKVSKIDEKDFSNWLEDQYLINFAFGDLKDYALRLLSKNPKAIKKMKGAYADFKDNSLI